MYKLSIIIPALNEYHSLAKQQEFLKSLLEQGHEVIVADGGSTDETVLIAEKIGCVCISSKASRGHQQHVGANASSHDVLVFLHADTSLSTTAIESIEQSFKRSNANWGRFNIKFANKKLIFKIIAWLMNKRSCITGVVTGDHTIYVKRNAYFDCGGFSDIPIMEDISFCKKLKKYSRPICLSDYALTSSRKWEQDGILKTILLMWRLRILFYFGVSADHLVRQYYS